MIEQEFRTLDVLSRKIGSTASIRHVTDMIQAKYGTGDYKNVHSAIKKLEKNKLLALESAGRSSMVRLNFENYMIIDLLAEVELRKKRDFLGKRQEMKMLLMDVDMSLHAIPFIKSVSLLSPERNTKLNKVELMIQIQGPKRRCVEGQTQINTVLASLQTMHNVKINSLILNDDEFFNLLKSNEANPVKETLYGKIVTLHPQRFWMSIRGKILQGITILSEEHEFRPATLPAEDLIFNLARFGYSELGSRVRQGRALCIEYVISAVLCQNDARRIDAVPVILAKNPRVVNYTVLLFLAQRYGFEGDLLGILKALRSLVRGKSDFDEPVALLEAMKVKEKNIDARRIKERLDLYNVA